VEEGFRQYSDVREVFSIAAPETLEVVVVSEAQLGISEEAFQFSWLVLQGEGLIVRTSCSRLEEWHEHIGYKQPRSREEYSKEAVELHEARFKQRFENAGSMIQWSKSILQKELAGGFISIRLANWWGTNLVPHSFTCFAAVSNNWIVMGTIEEDVPLSTGAIVTSFAFLPEPKEDKVRVRQGETEARNWD
jgi:hypothetical protein